MNNLEALKDDRINLQDKLIKIYEERIAGLERHVEQLEARLAK